MRHPHFELTPELETECRSIGHIVFAFCSARRCAVPLRKSDSCGLCSMTLLWLCEMSLSGAAAPRTDGLPALALREAPRQRHERRVAAPSIRTFGALAKPTALLTCKMYEAYVQLRYDRNWYFASILLPFGLSGLPEGFGTRAGVPHFGKAAALFRVVRRWRHRHAPFWLLPVGKEGVTENGQQDQAFRASPERT